VTEYLDLTDYLLIAEAVTGIDAVVLAKAARLASWIEVRILPES
jgi:hypothetical protein